MRATIYCHKGNSHQAVADYSQAIKLNPNYAEAYAGRGVSSERDGDFSETVLLDFNKAIRLKTDLQAQVYYGRGTFYYIKGKYDKAISDYYRAIAVNPNSVEAYCGMGNSYYAKGDYEQANYEYSKAIAINPNYSEAYANRAMAFYFMKEFTNAWDDVHKAEILGGKINLSFLENLKKESGGEK